MARMCQNLISARCVQGLCIFCLASSSFQLQNKHAMQSEGHSLCPASLVSVTTLPSPGPHSRLQTLRKLVLSPRQGTDWKAHWSTRDVFLLLHGSPAPSCLSPIKGKFQASPQYCPCIQGISDCNPGGFPSFSLLLPYEGLTEFLFKTQSYFLLPALNFQYYLFQICSPGILDFLLSSFYAATQRTHLHSFPFS